MQETYLTGAECAEISGVSVRTIERWASSGTVKTGKHGYGLVSILLERQRRLIEERDRAKESIEQKQDRLYIAKCRKLEAEARMKELEADEMEGQLVNASQVIEQWQNLIVRCRSKLLSIPSRLALELAGKEPPEIKLRLTEVVDEALVELSSDKMSDV